MRGSPLFGGHISLDRYSVNEIGLGPGKKEEVKADANLRIPMWFLYTSYGKTSEDQ
jgi:hypothetical protein